MRAFKRTSIQWGLATIPVGLASTFRKETGNGLKRYVQGEDGEFHSIASQEVSAVTGGEIDGAAVRYGIEIGDKVHIVDEAKLETAKAAAILENIEIVEFIPASRLDAAAVTGSYYLQPQPAFPGATKAMGLLHGAMKAEKVIAVAKLCPRSKQTRAALVPHESGALVLLTLAWETNRNQPDAEVLSPTAEKLAASERKAARDLVKMMTAPESDTFESMTDDLSAEVEKLLSGAIEKRELAPAPGQTKKALDVIADLQATVAAMGEGGPR